MHSAPGAGTSCASLQPTHPSLLEGSSEHHQPGPPRGWDAANMHWRPSADKALHTDSAKRPGSSLLIAVLASEPT